jgi:molecular chaperone GrpE
MEAEETLELKAASEPSEVERLREELRREQEMHVRSLADFDNYRRRVERDREVQARRGKRDIILSLLDIVDNFDRALKHVGDSPPAVSQGLEALYRKLQTVLEAQGVTSFPTLGQPFDPKMHEAIGSVESAEYESGTVADEVQRGYLWGGELLRPARVLVAQ